MHIPGMPGGRPSTYRPEYAEIARKLALLGKSDAQIADILGLKSDRTDDPFMRWKRRFPEFAEALARGRERSYAEVAATLFERAMGWSQPAVKIFPPRKEGGKPVIVEYIERFPPDTQAAMFILTNREPDLWSNKQTVEHEIGSKLADRLEAARVRALDQLVGPTVDATVVETVVQPAIAAQEPQKP
jgi:hypothetical protein